MVGHEPPTPVMPHHEYQRIRHKCCCIDIIPAAVANRSEDDKIVLSCYATSSTRTAKAIRVKRAPCGYKRPALGGNELPPRAILSALPQQ
jgi:hypothetical protein